MNDTIDTLLTEIIAENPELYSLASQGSIHAINFLAQAAHKKAAPDTDLFQLTKRLFALISLTQVETVYRFDLGVALSQSGRERLLTALDDVIEKGSALATAAAMANRAALMPTAKSDFQEDPYTCPADPHMFKALSHILATK